MLFEQLSHPGTAPGMFVYLVDGEAEGGIHFRSHHGQDRCSPVFSQKASKHKAGGRWTLP
jgi:hypothetical protein